MVQDSATYRSIGDKTKLGIFYTIISNAGQFCIKFGSSIVLARILFPEDFGLMAVVSIVMQLATRLTNFGFIMVLVQRKEIRREHLDTVFVTNLCLMTLLTAGVYFSSPLFAEFFNNNHLKDLIRVTSFNFLLLAISSVPRAVLRRRMEFKELELSISIGKFIGVMAAVGLALSGFGVWALILGNLIDSAIVSVTLSYFSKYIPRFKFNFSALKDVFGFGMWVYIAGYVNYGINKIDFFLVGKILSVIQLGFYERAFNLMSLPRQQIARRVGMVMFSSYARIQDNVPGSMELLTKTILYISLITYPLMVWMFFTAPALIVNLFGPKWIPSVFPFQVMCIAGLLDTLTLVMEPSATARGFIGNRVRRDIAYLFVLGIAVLIGTRWGIDGVACGTTAASFVRLALMFNLVKSTLSLSLGEFLRAQKSAFVYSVLIFCCLLILKTAIIEYVDIYSILMLFCMTACTVAVIVLAQLIFRFEDVAAVLKQLAYDLRALKHKFAQAKI